jgi:hypothetical protein
MSRFTQLLSGLDSRLKVPEPARSRILLEVAADMEDLGQEYLDRGVSEDEADAAVLDHFDLSEEAILELVRVHDTPFQRGLGRFSGQIESLWARLLLVILALLVALGSGVLLFRGQLYRDASALVWIVMPILGWGLWVAGSHVRRLLKAGEIRRSTAGPGPGRLLALAASILGVTASGLWVELYLSGLRIRDVPGEALIHLVEWLYMTSATLVIALSGALVLGFLWFFLESATRRREALAVSDLLRGGGS